MLEAGFALTLVGWEICVRHTVMDDAAWARIEAFDTPLSRFFTTVNAVTRDFCKAHQRLAGSTHPDAIAVAGIAQPSLFTQSVERHVAVETASALTRGMTVVDELGVTGRPPNARVVTEADGPAFQAMLFELLQSQR